MLLRIDSTSAVPLFEQITGGIRLGIMHGDISSGERLPSAREMAESLELNLHTVLRAYQVLRDEGLIELRRGRGAIVIEGGQRDLTELNTQISSLIDLANAQGIERETLISMVRESYR